MRAFPENIPTIEVYFWKIPAKGRLFSFENCAIKILRIFLSVGHPRDPKGEDQGYLTTFRVNAPKSMPFKYENNAQTLPKQL